MCGAVRGHHLSCGVSAPEARNSAAGPIGLAEALFSLVQCHIQSKLYRVQVNLLGRPASAQSSGGATVNYAQLLSGTTGVMQIMIMHTSSTNRLYRWLWMAGSG